MQPLFIYSLWLLKTSLDQIATICFKKELFGSSANQNSNPPPPQSNHLPAHPSENGSILLNELKKGPNKHGPLAVESFENVLTFY